MISTLYTLNLFPYCSVFRKRRCYSRVDENKSFAYPRKCCLNAALEVHEHVARLEVPQHQGSSASW